MNDRALDRLFCRFAQRHDGVALAAVFDATWKELFEVACHLNRDAAQAEDLVQATFVTAISKAKEYDGSTPLRGWLYGILWREAAKARRESARRVDPARLPERREPEPIEGLLAREVPEAVQRALAGLPASYREVLEPLIHDGQKPEEIAARLARSPGTIRSQIHRGLERLRKLLPRDFAPFAGVVPMRGMENVRGDVLQFAGFSPAIAAGASALWIQASVASVLASKLALAGLAATLIAAATWFAASARRAAPETSELRAHASSLPSAHDVAVDDAQARATLDDPPARADAAQAPRASVSVSEPRPAPTAADEIAAWLARYDEHPDDWRHGLAVTRELARLEPDASLRILRGVWPRLSVAVREQALKPFVFDGGKPNALDVLHLGALDPAPSVRERAFGYLCNYAFRDFAADPAAYALWEREFRGRPLAEVLTENARRFAAELAQLSPTLLEERLRAFEALELDAGEAAGIDLASVLRDAGMLDVLAGALASTDAHVQALALRGSRGLEADETWLRRHVLPRIASETRYDLLSAAFDALGRPDCAWAQPQMLDYLRRQSELAPSGPPADGAPPREGGMQGSRADAELPATRSAARALAKIGDPAAIPALIETLLHDRSRRLSYDIGYFALAKLTGVEWETSCDGAWWLRWWDENAERFPPHVRAMTIRR